MSENSAIEWTDATWNTITGCTKKSEGCRNCYAKQMAEHLQRMGQRKYVDGFKLKIHEPVLDDPGSWKKPRRIFVNSMSDTFHEEVPEEFIQKIFKVMHENERHTFQVLTKRSERLRDLSRKLDWSSNIWMGVTVENTECVHRIDDLHGTGSRVKFLSLEPLLSAIPKLDLHDIDWVIVGGESGSYARPMDPDWVRDIRDQCSKAGVAFYFKQWGSKNKKGAGRILDDRIWDDMPRLRSN